MLGAELLPFAPCSLKSLHWRDLPLRAAPSPQGLLTSNRSTGPICPAGQLEAPHPDLPLNASGRPSPHKGRGGAGAEAPGRGVGEIIIKRRAAIGKERGGHKRSVGLDEQGVQRRIIIGG